MNQPQLNPDPIYNMENVVQDDDNIDLLRYWRVVRKYLYEIIGLAIAVGILAALVANSMTPIYTASTKVSIERVQPATGGYTDISWFTMQQYPGTQYQIIKSKAVAEKVVENLTLWEHPHFKNDSEKSGFNWRSFIPFLNNKEKMEDTRSEEEKLKAKKEGLVGMVMGGITVNPIKDSFVVEIGFSSSNPEVAALVANGVVDAYVQRNLEARFKEVKKVSDWMTESPVSYTHLTLPTTCTPCRSRWSPYH